MELLDEDLKEAQAGHGISSVNGALKSRDIAIFESYVTDEHLSMEIGMRGTHCHPYCSSSAWLLPSRCHGSCSG